jgi:hypothetical protein
VIEIVNKGLNHLNGVYSGVTRHNIILPFTLGSLSPQVVSDFLHTRYMPRPSAWDDRVAMKNLGHKIRSRDRHTNPGPPNAKLKRCPFGLCFSLLLMLQLGNWAAQHSGTGSTWCPPLLIHRDRVSPARLESSWLSPVPPRKRRDTASNWAANVIIRHYLSGTNWPRNYKQNGFATPPVRVHQVENR